VHEPATHVEGRAVKLIRRPKGCPLCRKEDLEYEHFLRMPSEVMSGATKSSWVASHIARDALPPTAATGVTFFIPAEDWIDPIGREHHADFVLVMTSCVDVAGCADGPVPRRSGHRTAAGIPVGAGDFRTSGFRRDARGLLFLA
jgi:hypothetical protein